MYSITFHEELCDIGAVLNKTYDIFQQRMTKLQEDYHVKVRLVAQVSYHHLNDKHEIVDEKKYHFTSYSMEEVKDISEFYKRHLNKIISRMDSFHEGGSRLLLHRINHIHIRVMKLPKQTN